MKCSLHRSDLQRFCAFGVFLSFAQCKHHNWRDTPTLPALTSAQFTQSITKPRSGPHTTQTTTTLVSTQMLQRQLALQARGVKSLCHNLQQQLCTHRPSASAVTRLLRTHSLTQHPSSMSAAADAEHAATTATSSSSSQVVVYDKDVLQRTIRGVVFDM